MYCEFISKKGTWREVADSANTTIGKDAGTKEPSSKWKKRMLLCEHSPIRQIWIKAKWYDLKSWVSVHLVRHWLGIVHWVKSQRDDRCDVGIIRDDAPQSTPINHEFEANSQAIINISRRRLCTNASLETRQAWRAFLDTIKDIESELESVCVPDCIYRGYCYEYKTCGYYKSDEYKNRLEEYRADVRGVSLCITID
jgi:hypothetical protein